MDRKAIDLELSKVAGGAIQEKLDGELKKVFDNIHDPNTGAEAKRIINIKLTFQPQKDRQVVSFDSDFTTKLAPPTGVGGLITTGRDLDTGRIEAYEVKSSIPGQSYFDEDSTLRTDVGDPIEEKQRNVINMQKGSN